jgi:hypothetical protein
MGWGVDESVRYMRDKMMMGKKQDKDMKNDEVKII